MHVALPSIVVGTHYLPHCYHGSVSWASTIDHGKAPHIHYLIRNHVIVTHLSRVT